VHEKSYLPDEKGYWEHSWYDRGSKTFDTARWAEVRIGVQICTEMWFFEWARHYAAARADLLCVPRATPHGSVDKWLAGGRRRPSVPAPIVFHPTCWPATPPMRRPVAWIIDPEGNILAKTDFDTPFATVDIDLSLARTSKSTYPRYVPE
jgi:N-carbamoylputrescine amidase